MIRLIFEIIRDNINYSSEIIAISTRNQKRAYNGSDLGRIWAIVKPGMYIIGFWIAMSIGFRSSKNIQGINCPYFIWLMSGLVAWFYIRENITGGACCFKKNKGMLLKSTMPSTIIPTIQSIQGLAVHSILLVIVMIVALLMGVRPTVYWLQLPIYIGFLILYSIAWSFFSGCLTVISKDFFNLLRSVSPMLVWLSGVMFDSNSRGAGRPKVIWMFRLNPITYLAEGYRNCFCREVWFFQEPIKLACFFGTMTMFFVLGLLMYKRIKKKLPDIV